MDNDNQLSPVLISAHLASIKLVSDFELPTGSKNGLDYSVTISRDEEKILESGKKPGIPSPQWKWEKDRRFFFHPSSIMTITVYRQTKGRISKRLPAGQHKGKITELLENKTIIDLEDESGKRITLQIEIDLSLTSEPENDFGRLMEGVGSDVSRLDSTIPTFPGISALGTVLQLTEKIMGIVSNAHPILKVSWTVLSAVYTAVQQTRSFDDTVRDLAEKLREILGVANECTDLPVIQNTTNVLEEIGRTSLRVASLIHEYTVPNLIVRTLNLQFSDNRKSRIAQCHKSFDDLKDKLDRRVIVGTNHRTERIENAAAEIKNAVNDSGKKIQNALKNMSTKEDWRDANIYRWLSAPDSSKIYNEAREMHQRDTFSWFFNGRQFSEQQKKAIFLWIKGTAGCGKTVLCSTIIEKVIELRKKEESIAYAYFFFDGRDSQNDLQLHDKLIRSLVLQLSLQCKKVPQVLVELYGHGYQQPSTNSFEDALQSIIAELASTYIIIDSLDECLEREKTLQWIHRIVSRKMNNLHIVVASRPERDINDSFQLLDPDCVDLAGAVSQDIATYLDHELSLVKKWDDETRAIVKTTLTRQAKGMFRLVALQLMELKKCSNRPAIIKQLKTLPNGLYEIYDRILLRIDKRTDCTDTKILLRWLCFSVRPMTLKEIAEVVAVNSDTENSPVFSPLHRYWDERDILEKCSGLIIESEGRIKLAHFSIKEYLMSEYLRTGAASNFHLTSEELSHSLISQTCLVYLLQFDDLESMLVSSPLADYAAQQWIFHARAGGIDKSESSITLKLAEDLFDVNQAKFTNWVRIWDLDRPYAFARNPERTEIASPLYYAALAGLQRLSQHLSEDADINMKGGRFGNALMAASYRGFETIVKLLVEKGANVDAQGGEYGNALITASYRGYEAVVRLLVEAGVDVHAQESQFGNALQAASFGGHTGIASLLLETGVDVNKMGGEYGNALTAASNQGDEAMVKLLLENGADVNLDSGEYGSALQAASYQGDEAIANLLVNHNADVNAQGGKFGNALQAASYKGYEAIAKMLLENGADVNAQGGEYGNALHAASSEGHEAIVVLLLEEGADEAVEGVFGTALQAAALKGHESIVGLLLMR